MTYREHKELVVTEDLIITVIKRPPRQATVQTGFEVRIKYKVHLGTCEGVGVQGIKDWS